MEWKMARKNDGLTKQAYEIIKKRLITCEYPPNTILNEARLSAELGYSRTPTREAIIQLEKEGFLQVLPKKGIYVTAITINDVLQIFQVRKEIEPVVMLMGKDNLDQKVLLDFKERFSKDVENVMEGYRLDTAMHMYLIESCGNSFIIKMMHEVFDKNTRVIIASKENQLHVKDSRAEHLEIINLLLEGKCQDAAQKMSEHVDHCKLAALDSFYSVSPVTNTQTYKQYL